MFRPLPAEFGIISLLFLAVPATADTSKRTIVKFGEPVAIAGNPEVTLGPGTYILRLLNSEYNRNIVQFLSEREDYVFTTVLTIPAIRTDGDEFKLWDETPSGNRALRYWFPPGEQMGHEFLPPRSINANLAQHDRQTTLILRQDGWRQSNHGLDTNIRRRLDGVFAQIEKGDFRGARESIRRYSPLEQSREGALASFLVSLLMLDATEVERTFDRLTRIDPVIFRPFVHRIKNVTASLRRDGSMSKKRNVGDLLLALARELHDNSFTQAAVISYDANVLKGDPLALSLGLDQSRREGERDKRLADAEKTLVDHERQLVLNTGKIAELNRETIAMLNGLGALDVRTTALGKQIVLTDAKLRDLDRFARASLEKLSHRQSELTQLIAQRDGTMMAELNSLRKELQTSDWQRTQPRFAALQDWERSPPPAVARDLARLSAHVSSSMFTPSNLLKGLSGLVSVGPSFGPFSINVIGILSKISEWLGI